jgi:hypothetical protein
MRALLLCALVAAIVGIAMFACNPNSIGRPCINPGGQAVRGVQISSPALECPSRLCLLQPANASSGNIGQGTDGGVFRATCTALCGSDSDCDPETNKYCKEGFACAVASDVGPFCCRKMCICRADLQQGTNVDPDGGTILPFGCDAVHNPMATKICPNVH